MGLTSQRGNKPWVGPLCYSKTFSATFSVKVCQVCHKSSSFTKKGRNILTQTLGVNCKYLKGARKMFFSVVLKLRMLLNGFLFNFGWFSIVWNCKLMTCFNDKVFRIWNKIGASVFPNRLIIYMNSKKRNEI